MSTLIESLEEIMPSKGVNSNSYISIYGEGHIEFFCVIFQDVDDNLILSKDHNPELDFEEFFRYNTDDYHELIAPTIAHFFKNGYSYHTNAGMISLMSNEFHLMFLDEKNFKALCTESNNLIN